MGDEAMRCFMKGDGDNYWDHPNGRQVEHIRQAAVLRARLPHLLDLRNEATRFKKRNISAAIVAGAKRFCYQIIRTRFFGTHSPPICGCDWLAGDSDWTTISIAKAPMTGAEVGNEVIQIDYNAEVQKGAPLGNWP